MNMELFKSFINMRKELRENGVIGLNLYENEIHINWSSLIEEEDLQITDRFCNQYPYEISALKDGIKFFACITENELVHFPQLKDQLKALVEKKFAFLEEDVDLSGMSDEHAS